MVAKSWTTPEQVQFLRTFEDKYIKAATEKKISAFLATFFPLWFEKYPEEDASGDATDIEEASLSTSARKKLEKDGKAASARRVIIDAQAGIEV